MLNNMIMSSPVIAAFREVGCEVQFASIITVYLGRRNLRGVVESGPLLIFGLFRQKCQ